jgi:hypothetical protein
MVNKYYNVGGHSLLKLIKKRKQNNKLYFLF